MRRVDTEGGMVAVEEVISPPKWLYFGRREIPLCFDHFLKLWGANGALSSKQKLCPPPPPPKRTKKHKSPKNMIRD